jgi:hypothetical protein
VGGRAEGAAVGGASSHQYLDALPEPLRLEVSQAFRVQYLMMGVGDGPSRPDQLAADEAMRLPHKLST